MKLLNRFLVIFFAFFIKYKFRFILVKNGIWHLLMVQEIFILQMLLNLQKMFQRKVGKTYYSNSSWWFTLYKGGEIFRAVRTGQAQIGERFMSALGKEDPLLEVDSQPFLQQVMVML